jgi:hypothetical protein
MGLMSPSRVWKKTSLPKKYCCHLQVLILQDWMNILMRWKQKVNLIMFAMKYPVAY